MTDAFISYSRIDFKFGHKLHGALKGNDLDLWMDWKNIPITTKWWNEIRVGIEESDNFIFIISPNSISSPICNLELEYARNLNKRIIPIEYKEVNTKKAIFDLKSREMSDFVKTLLAERDITQIAKENWFEVSQINWLRFIQSDDIDDNVLGGMPLEDGFVLELVDAIKTDFEWKKVHTKLTEGAKKWETAQYRRKELLTRRELREAKANIDRVLPNIKPQPTEEIQNFVTASDEYLKKQRNLWIVGGGSCLSTVLLIICVLGVISSFQTNVARAAQTSEAEKGALAQSEATQRAEAEVAAEAQTKISRSGEVAKQAIELRNTNPVLSFLLSVEAYKMANTYQARSALFDSALAFPQLKQFISLYGSGLAYSPDGKTLAIGSGGSIILYDTITWQQVRSLNYPIEGISINNLAFSSDGKWLASGSNDGAVLLWNVNSGQLAYTLAEHNRWEDNLYIENLIFNSNGQVLVSSRNDGTVNVWNIGSDKPQLIFSRKVPCSPDIDLGVGIRIQINHAIAISPDGKTLAICDDPNYFSLWDTITGKQIGQTINKPQGNVASLVFSPDGKTLISSDTKNEIIFWDISTGQAIHTLTGSGMGNYSIAISPDGKTLAYGKDNSIFLWDTITKQLRNTLVLGENTSVVGDELVFSPDGSTLVSRTNNLILVWDMVESHPIVETLIGHKSAVKNVDFNLQNDTLVSISDVGTAITWDVITGNIISTESGQPPQQNFEKGTPENIFVRNEGNRIELFDKTTDDLIGQPLVGHSAYIETVVFSPDGKTLATGSDDKTIILWDIASGEQIVRLVGHTGRVFDLAFSSDGKKLASASEDGTVRIWNIDPWSWMEEVCRRAGRNIQMPEDTSNFGTADWENYVPDDEWTEYFPGEGYRITCPQWPARNYSEGR